jgi:hypothetical protein
MPNHDGRKAHDASSTGAGKRLFADYFRLTALVSIAHPRSIDGSTAVQEKIEKTKAISHKNMHD